MDLPFGQMALAVGTRLGHSQLRVTPPERAPAARYPIASSLSVTSADGGRVVALVAFGNVIVAAVRFGGDAAEYEAAKQAIREKGARLRALRLARDAAKQSRV